MNARAARDVTRGVRSGIPFVTSVAIVLVAVSVGGVAAWRATRRSTEGAVDGLSALAATPSRLIGSVAASIPREPRSARPDGLEARVLERILDEIARLGTFGQTGEFLLADRAAGRTA